MSSDDGLACRPDEAPRRSCLLALAAAPLGAAALAACAAPGGPTAPPLTRDEATAQLRAAETAFAATMAARDLAAFASHIADDAVFVNGGRPLRGREAIVEHWKRFFAAPAAPFAWRPELAEVTGNADLGYTEGPVALPDGRVVARFFTTWRRSPDGRWRVAFDNGYDTPPCARP